MDFNELSNSPVEMEFAGKKWKVRRVSLDTIFGKAEAAVLSAYIKRVQETSSCLTGREKIEFLVEAMSAGMPTGEKLNDLTADYLKSIAGIKMVLVDALVRDQPDVEKDLNFSALMQADKAGLMAAVNFAVENKERKSESPLAQAGDNARK